MNGSVGGTLCAVAVLSGIMGCRGTVGTGKIDASRKPAGIRETPAELRIQKGQGFRDVTVLQRDEPIVIQGSGGKEREIVIDFGGRTRITRGDSATGLWRDSFPPFPGGGPYEFTIRSARETRVVSNVFVGERWLLAGDFSRAGRRERPGAAPPSPDSPPRFYLPLGGRAEDASALSSSRSGCDAIDWNAVFGWDLASELGARLSGVPVGILSFPNPGAPKSGVGTNADSAHTGEAESARNADSTEYGRRFEAMAKHPLRGVIWFDRAGVASGDRNAYRLAALTNRIVSCVNAPSVTNRFWLTVQLDSFGETDSDGEGGAALAQYREDQRRSVSRIPSAATLWSVDLGATPMRSAGGRAEITDRIVRAVGALAYGRDGLSSGPVAGRVSLEVDRLRVFFEEAGEGLAWIAETEPSGIEIAGANKRFLRAETRVDGKTLVAWHPEIAEPLHIRHAWKNHPGRIALVNSEGLPALPFDLSVGIDP